MKVAVYGKVQGVRGHMRRVVDPVTFVEAWGRWAQQVMMASAEDPLIVGNKMVWTEIVTEEEDD